MQGKGKTGTKVEPRKLTMGKIFNIFGTASYKTPPKGAETKGSGQSRAR